MTPVFTAGELERLLGRAPRASIGPDERASCAGRRVLITGAAGSIGSELAREVTASAPAVVGLVDHSELGLFTIERELRSKWPGVAIEPYLADVAHTAAIARLTKAVRPDVVYHAAAYKHVTMAERAPAAAVRVNVLGSIVVARAAASVGARFVLISSDKAADPKSVMGATKRVAEMATLATATPAFRPIVVRFGNVIGSSGSVVAIMREAIRAGRSVPITDPDATRYFMTAGEAVTLVIRADALARAAEIFWLDMGDPVRMGDLTERLMAVEAEAGFARTPIEVIGLRPGEKRNETLADPQLTFQRTIDSRILVGCETERLRPGLVTWVARLTRAGLRDDDQGAVAALSGLLGSFVPSAQAAEAGRRQVAHVVTQRPRRRGRAAAA